MLAPEQLAEFSNDSIADIARFEERAA